MTDLRSRFQTLDALHAPEMWREIEARAQAKERHVTRRVSLVLIALAVMLALVVGAAVLVGSGVVKLSTTAPSTTATTTPFTAPSTTPTAPPTPRAAAWIATGSMVEARFYHTATLLSDGRVLVAGGSNGSKKLATAELYDPGSGSWTATGSMLEARSNHTATLLADGRVLVAGGALVAPGGSSYKQQHAELYDPDTGTWSATGDLSFISYRRPTATLLADGMVLLVPDGHSSWVYTPGTGTWRATQGMVDQADGYAATRLPDGTVLVAGGSYGEPGQALATAQLFDPANRTWTATGSLREPRSFGVATLLLDGTVLVAGGHGAGEELTASASCLTQPAVPGPPPRT
jgi:hypothetical protein